LNKSKTEALTLMSSCLWHYYVIYAY